MSNNVVVVDNNVRLLRIIICELENARVGVTASLQNIKIILATATAAHDGDIITELLRSDVVLEYIIVTTRCLLPPFNSVCSTIKEDSILSQSPPSPESNQQLTTYYQRQHKRSEEEWGTKMEVPSMRIFIQLCFEQMTWVSISHIRSGGYKFCF